MGQDAQMAIIITSLAPQSDVNIYIVDLFLVS
jgi:hypothetical protein